MLEMCPVDDTLASILDAFGRCSTVDHILLTVLLNTRLQ